MNQEETVEETPVPYSRPDGDERSSVVGFSMDEARMSEKKPSTLRFVFFGPDGLRPGWGLLLFLAIFLMLGRGINLAVQKVHPPAHKTDAERKAETAKPQTARNMLIGEGSSFALLALVTWIMSKVERRPVGVYGLGGRRKVSRFLSGFAWGLVFLSMLVGALWKAGLVVFDGRLLSVVAALEWGAVWLLGFTLVGLLEEYLLRGYVQYTLARGAASLYTTLFDTKHSKVLGFWTAAAFLSFVFGFGHGSNPGESPIGMLSAGLIGLVFCLTLWRTGSLWWALGFHAAWDWAQSFVFGVADSGLLVEGRFLQTHPAGKVLLSGGATGPEGSVFILPLLAAVAVVALLLRGDGTDEPANASGAGW